MNAIRGILATMVVFLYSCGGGGREQATGTEDGSGSKALVKVLKVQEQPVEQLIELTGTVRANISNDIAATIPGRIDEILVEVGDCVRKGQILVRMDRSSLLQTGLQQDNAEKELERVKELHKSGSATRQQLDQLTTTVEVTREALRNLEENTVLLSPIDGVVTARNFDPKNIYPGTPAILNVMQISPVKIMVSISESFFPQVKTGMETKIRLDVFPGKLFEGKISLIYPTIDHATRTFVAEISIPNSDMTLRPGMFVRAELNFGTINRVAVPDMAVIRQMGTNSRYVFVVENGVAYQKTVELGRRHNNAYELLSGISGGTLVVVAGQTRLLDGMEVIITDN